MLARQNQSKFQNAAFFWSTYKKAVFVHLFWFLHTDTIVFKTLFFLSRGGALCNNFISYVQTTKLLQTMCQLDHKAIKNTFILALIDPCAKNMTHLNWKFLLIKSSEKHFISLPAFYLIMWLMISPKNFEKIVILKIWQLVFFWGAKTDFGMK